MGDMENKIDAVFETIINFLSSHERDLTEYAPGVILKMKEIHFIDTIGRYESLNIKRIASISGHNKSTVSRQVSSLAKQGYIEKFQHEDNKKEIYVRLTDLGRKAYEGHIEFHERRRYLCYEKMDSYSNREKDLILEFLSLYRDSLFKHYGEENSHSPIDE